MANSISICIPCYNSERYVRTTIESALAQTMPASEILISDDRSPDRSFEIIKEYEGIARLRITRPPRRTTIGGHYRFLLDQSTADYICFLSSDDALMPDFVETMHQELEGEENIALVAGGCLETSSNLVPLRIRGIGAPRSVLNPPAGFHFMTKGLHYNISFSLFSRQLLLQTPILPAEADLVTDWFWALLLGTRGKFKFVRRPMGFYRVHSSNAGHNNKEGIQQASLVMLEFLEGLLEPELGHGLESLLNHELHDSQRLDRGEGVRSVNIKNRAMNLVKSAIALVYRKLPAAIQMAEQGVGLALKRQR